MLKTLAVIVSFFLFFGSGAAPYSYKNPDEIKLSAVVLSDMHMETNNPLRFAKDGSTLSGVYSGGNSPDVLTFAGDNTMNGQSLEWFDFYGFIGRFNRGSDVLVAMGNHDFGNTADEETYEKLSARAIEKYNYYCGADIDKVYYSRDYGEAKFIMLASEHNAENTVQVITDEQVEWLRNELADCVSQGKTAVVINHNPLYGRNGDRSYYGFNQIDGGDAVDEALQSCGAKVVYVSGHTHFGLSSSSVTQDGDVTYVNLPSAGNDGNYRADEGGADHGIGMIMEFYEDTLEISFRNFATGKSFDYYSLSIDLK